MNNAHIRLLTPDDTASYRDIRLESLQLNPEAFGSTYEREISLPSDWFTGRLTGSHSVVGAFDYDTLIGVSGLVVHQGKSSHKGLLWGMYVRPQARNRGVGRSLVEAVIEIARTKVEILQLCVVTENTSAARLYSCLGFTQYGLEKHALKYKGRYFDELLMAIDFTI